MSDSGRNPAVCIPVNCLSTSSCRCNAVWRFNAIDLWIHFCRKFQTSVSLYLPVGNRQHLPFSGGLTGDKPVSQDILCKVDRSAVCPYIRLYAVTQGSAYVFTADEDISSLGSEVFQSGLQF